MIAPSILDARSALIDGQQKIRDREALSQIRVRAQRAEDLIWLQNQAFPVRWLLRRCRRIVAYAATAAIESAVARGVIDEGQGTEFAAIMSRRLQPENFS